MAGRAEAPPIGRGAARAKSVALRRPLGLLPQAIAYLFLTAWAVLALVPVYWMVVSALKAQSENLAVPPQWIPSPAVLDNFRSCSATPTSAAGPSTA